MSPLCGLSVLVTLTEMKCGSLRPVWVFCVDPLKTEIKCWFPVWVSLTEVKHGFPMLVPCVDPQTTGMKCGSP